MASTVYAQNSVSGLTASWQHFTLALVPGATDPNARLVLRISQAGSVYLDFVSLFPKQTFNNRTNGLRPDLANLLVNLKPAFMRFPGGSWVDGTSLANAYHWEPTVGDPANRIPRNNVWGYVVDNGLGYHEYLQMCEDLGTRPLFDINCGMDVNQNAVPTNQLGSWVQEALDRHPICQWRHQYNLGCATRCKRTSRAVQLAIHRNRNENGGSAYNANYSIFYDSIKSNYPAMNIIACSWGGIPSSRPVEIMDEHYYQSASWFAQNSHQV